MKYETQTSTKLRSGRHFEMLEETRHDPYQETGKLPEPAVCSNCGAVYSEGRWQWIPSPIDAYLARCSA